MGSEGAPPRDNGQLAFNRSWEQVAFALAIALSKKGCYEWEEFRQNLIATIGEWESEHDLSDPTWDYYHCWYAVLEKLALASGVVDPAELEEKLGAILACERDHE